MREQKRGSIHGTCQAWQQARPPPQEDPEPGQGLLWDEVQEPPHRQAGGGPGRELRLSRPQAEEAPDSQPVDRAHQRRGASPRPQLQPAHPRLEGGGLRPRPQGPRRHRRARRRGVRPSRRGGEAGAGSSREGEGNPRGGLMAEETAGLADVAEYAGRFEEEASRVSDRAGWEDLRVRWMGRKQGEVRALLSRTGQVPAADRKSYGSAVNTLKEQVESRLAAIDEGLTAREREAVRRAAAVDVTLPGRRPHVGSLHPI